MIDAVVCMEDQRFYQHRGVDFRALVRAAKSLIENRKITQGKHDHNAACQKCISDAGEDLAAQGGRDFIAQNLEKNIPRIRFWNFI